MPNPNFQILSSTLIYNGPFKPTLRKGKKFWKRDNHLIDIACYTLYKGKEGKKKSHWLQAYNNIMAWLILIIEYYRYKVQQIKFNIFRSRTNKNDTNACIGIIEKCLARNPLI